MDTQQHQVGGRRVGGTQNVVSNPPGCRSTRKTHHIARRPASALLHAERVAKRIGRPINTEVRLLFWLSDLPPEAMSKVFETKIRGRKFAYWSAPKTRGQRKPRNGPPTFLWVAEGGPEKAHIHWCLHLKPGQEASFREALEKWCRAVPELRAVPFDDLVKIRRLHDADRYKLYLVKGIDPFYGKAWNVRRLEAQGEIIGKRSGVSANLCRAARKALDHDSPAR